MSSRNTMPTGIEGLDKMVTGFPRGGLITISGNPGTGKTALAGAFIYNGGVKFNEPGVYASFLEDEERFFDFMSSFGLDFRSLRDKGLFKYLAIPTLFEPGMSISIADILETVESIGAKRLAIDSFTALSQMFKSPPEARVFLHSLLSKIARQMDCTTILIKEVQSEQAYEYGFEEFVSDGVILLRREIIEDRLFREVRILKMRGSQIKEPSACISLYKGFNIYPPLQITKNYYWGKRYEPPQDPSGAYTTGIPDLDREIGGYVDGSTILIDIDPKISLPEYSLIYGPTAVSYALKNRLVLMIPSGGADWRDIIYVGKSFGVPEDVLARNLRILIDVERREELPQNVMKTSLEDPDEIFDKILQVVESSISRGESSPLISLGVDRLASRLREMIIEVLYRASNLIRNTGGLIIFIMKPIYPWIAERLAPASDYHLRITKKHGRVILYGIKPHTGFYIVEPAEDNLTPKLIPIV